MSARLLDATKAKAYEIYVTDTLRIIAKSIGIYPSKRFAEILSPPERDKRTGDEIAADIIKRAGITVLTAAKEEAATG